MNIYKKIVLCQFIKNICGFVFECVKCYNINNAWIFPVYKTISYRKDKKHLKL